MNKQTTHWRLNIKVKSICIAFSWHNVSPIHLHKCTYIETHTKNCLPVKSIPLWWFITTTAPWFGWIFSKPRTSYETPIAFINNRKPQAGNLFEIKTIAINWAIERRCKLSFTFYSTKHNDCFDLIFICLFIDELTRHFDNHAVAQ